MPIISENLIWGLLTCGLSEPTNSQKRESPRPDRRLREGGGAPETRGRDPVPTAACARAGSKQAPSLDFLSPVLRPD